MATAIQKRHLKSEFSLLQTYGAFQKLELAGRTMAGAVILMKEISFFQETLLKNHLLCAYYLGFD